MVESWNSDLGLQLLDPMLVQHFPSGIKDLKKEETIASDKENTTKFQILLLMTALIHCPWSVS